MRNLGVAGEAGGGARDSRPAVQPRHQRAQTVVAGSAAAREVMAAEGRAAPAEAPPPPAEALPPAMAPMARLPLPPLAPGRLAAKPFSS